MNILARVDRYLPDVLAGSEVTMHQVLKLLVQRGHQVLVLRDGATDAWLDGIEIHGPQGAGELADAYDWCDVVITQQAYIRKVLQEAQGRSPVAYYAHNTNSLLAAGVRPGEVSLVVYNSAYTAGKVRWLAPSIICRPPVLVDDFATPRPGGAVLQVNLSAKKGGPMFWWLARRLPAVQFIGVLGGYGDQINGKLPNVTILPSQGDLRAVYARADMLLMPSEKETFGRVALEAACSGVPLVLSRIDGLLEAVGEENALWAHPGEPGAWLGHVGDLCTSANLRMDMGIRARARAEEMAAYVDADILALENALYSTAAHRSARVWAVASETHYADHVCGYMACVHPQDRGAVLVPPDAPGSKSFWPAAERAARLGIPFFPLCVVKNRTHKADILAGMGGCDTAGSVALVVSERDRHVAEQLFPRRVVRGEHGAGQSYHGVDNPAFPGGDGHTGCLAATAPSESAARKIGAKHPGLYVATVGCPRLEPMRRALGRCTDVSRSRPARLALSFRYPGGEGLCAELGSAWPFYRGFTDLPPTWEVGLHAHPRAWELYPGLAQEAGAKGWRILKDFWDVLEWADVYAVDNSSTALEWLELRGGHLVLLNCPEYRRWVTHGLRFWEMESWPGVTSCTNAEQLLEAVEAALLSPPPEVWSGYAKCEPARLGKWLASLLRPADALTKIRVLQSLDGEAGRLHAGQVVSVRPEYAELLAARGMVTPMPVHPPVQVLPPGEPHQLGGWPGVLCEEAELWRG